MTDLTSVEEVRGLQNELRTTFGTDSGKETMKFLEQLCGWYDFTQTETEAVLNANGRRQVLATIKTLLKLTPEQVVGIQTQKEMDHAG